MATVEEKWHTSGDSDIASFSTKLHGALNPRMKLWYTNNSSFTSLHHPHPSLTDSRSDFFYVPRSRCALHVCATTNREAGAYRHILFNPQHADHNPLEHIRNTRQRDSGNGAECTQVHVTESVVFGLLQWRLEEATVAKALMQC